MKLFISFKYGGLFFMKVGLLVSWKAESWKVGKLEKTIEYTS